MTLYLSRLALSLAAAAMASPALADNRSRVEAVALPDGTFEVVADFSEDALYWCGASVAAQRAGLAGVARIYVVAGPGPSQTQPGQTAVRFAPTPPEGSARTQSFTNSVDLVGNSLTVSQAFQTCGERSASG